MSVLIPRYGRRKRTLLQLLDKVSDNLLQFGGVDGEDVLELLDLLQEVLGKFMAGT
jgi:hypothetical protein